MISAFPVLGVVGNSSLHESVCLVTMAYSGFRDWETEAQALGQTTGKRWIGHNRCSLAYSASWFLYYFFSPGFPKCCFTLLRDVSQAFKVSSQRHSCCLSRPEAEC